VKKLLLMVQQVKYSEMNKSEFFAVCSVITKIRINDDDQVLINRFFESLKDDAEVQNDFFEYCLVWKLAPWIYTRMESLGLSEQLVPQVLEKFREEHEKVRMANESRVNEALNFLREFREQGIDVAVLKGNLFIYSVYKDTGYKRMNDFDMLIHPEDWPGVQEIYDQLGYIPLGFGWSGEKQEAASFSHAGMSFISPDFRCITGTQWGLKSPTSKYNKHIINDIWDKIQVLEYHGTALKKLSPEYNLLHLVLHMGIYKIGIRDCMDVYNLLQVERIDEDLFISIAENARAIEKSYFTLMLANLCSGDISSSLLEKLRSRSKKSFIMRRLEKRLRMTGRTGDMQLSYNDYFHDVEMVVFYFNLYSCPHEKLPYFFRVFRMMFWPDIKLALKFCDSADRPGFRNRLAARIKAPYFTFSLIGEEIGVSITMLLFVKLFLDLFLSFKYYFVKGDNYFDYLKKRGVDAKNITAIVRNIQ